MTRKASFAEGRIAAWVGDITTFKADAIVNAANSSLLGGGGVDGAIHRAAGPSLLEECRKIRQTSHKEGLPPGEAVITSAGNLPSVYVIHTVGPIYREADPAMPVLLGKCYTNSLILAGEKGLRSIGFPAISTGVYGYPKEKAARVAGRIVAEFIALHSLPDAVSFIFFSEADAAVFLENCGLVP